MPKICLLPPGEACPHVPGLRRMDWPLEDPKVSAPLRNGSTSTSQPFHPSKAVSLRFYRACQLHAKQVLTKYA